MDPTTIRVIQRGAAYSILTTANKTMDQIAKELKEHIRALEPLLGGFTEREKILADISIDLALRALDEGRDKPNGLST